MWEPDDEPEEDYEEEPQERPWASLADWMRNGGLAALGGPARPAPAPPAPRPARPARPAARPAVPNRPAPLPPAPAGTAAVQSVDPQTLPEREQRRRDYVCQIAGSLNASFRVWYDRPPGLCEALDLTQPTDLRRCPRTATHAVRFQNDAAHADAYTCPDHARPLAAIAARSPYITASVYWLK